MQHFLVFAVRNGKICHGGEAARCFKASFWQERAFRITGAQYLRNSENLVVPVHFDTLRIVFDPVKF